MAKVEVFKPITARKLAKQLLSKTLNKKKYANDPAAAKKLITSMVKKISAKAGVAYVAGKTGKMTIESGTILAVGKKKTKKFGTLVDPFSGGPKDKWQWYQPIPLMPAGRSASPSLPELKPPVRIADPDVIEFNDDLLDVDIMADMIFEGIGGHEIINIARNDLVNGQSVIYEPIRNLTQLSLDYNSGTLLANENAQQTIFNNFGIFFEENLPNPGFNDAGELVSSLGTGPNGEIVYLEDSTGNIIINVINMQADERVEINLINSLEAFNDTIYVEGES